MTEQPNIKRAILRACLDAADAPESGRTADLREVAERNGWGEERVAAKVSDLSAAGLVEYGVSPMFPWVRHGSTAEVRAKLREYDE